MPAQRRSGAGGGGGSAPRQGRRDGFAGWVEERLDVGPVGDAVERGDWRQKGHLDLPARMKPPPRGLGECRVATGNGRGQNGQMILDRKVKGAFLEREQLAGIGTR